MKISQAATYFLARVKAAGYERADLTPIVGLDLFFDFYQQEEIGECERDGMGDRLNTSSHHRQSG